MEYTRKQIYEMGKKKFVTDIVNEILSNDDMDDNKIIDVLLDDKGNCIHITFSGGVSVEAIIAMGKAFGDDYPTIYGVSDNTMVIVIINNKYDCLIDRPDDESSPEQLA